MSRWFIALIAFCIKNYKLASLTMIFLSALLGNVFIILFPQNESQQIILSAMNSMYACSYARCEWKLTAIFKTVQFLLNVMKCDKWFIYLIIMLSYVGNFIIEISIMENSATLTLCREKFEKLRWTSAFQRNVIYIYC